MNKCLFPTVVSRSGSYLRINDHIFNRQDIVCVSKYTGMIRVETSNHKTYDIIVDYGYNNELTNVIFESIHSMLGPQTHANKY